MSKNKIVVFPGTFDPFHLGHRYVVEKIYDIFDNILIAITDNIDKNILFPIEKRIKIIEETTIKYQKKIKIIKFQGLLSKLIDNLEKEYEVFIARGVRNGAEFEHEITLFNSYQKLCKKEINPLIIPAKFPHISSSIIRNILRSSENKEDIMQFVDCNAISIIFD